MSIASEEFLASHIGNKNCSHFILNVYAETVGNLIVITIEREATYSFQMS